MTRSPITLGITLVLALAQVAWAEPDLRHPRRAGALTVYADHRRSDLFYYTPGNLSIATDADGRPDWSILQLRYLGDVSRGDQGTFVTRCVMNLRIALEPVAPMELERARLELTRGAGRVLLRPLPIADLGAGLVVLSVEEDGDEAQVLRTGRFEAAPRERPSSAGYWSERYYTVDLEDRQAMLIWDSLREQPPVLHFRDAFVAPGIAPEEDIVGWRGDAEVVAAVRRRLAERSGEVGEQRTVVHAGAFDLHLDPAHADHVLRRFDVEATLPPAFPLLDIYCFDFADGLRDDLYEKQIELAATGVSGRNVEARVTFRCTESDLFSQRVRFAHAARMDQPYRWRTIEIGLDGSHVVGPWEAAFTSEAGVVGLHWISSPPAPDEEVSVKIRYKAPPAKARLLSG